MKFTSCVKSALRVSSPASQAFSFSIITMDGSGFAAAGTVDISTPAAAVEVFTAVFFTALFLTAVFLAGPAECFFAGAVVCAETPEAKARSNTAVMNLFISGELLFHRFFGLRLDLPLRRGRLVGQVRFDLVEEYLPAVRAFRLMYETVHLEDA